MLDVDVAVDTVFIKCVFDGTVQIPVVANKNCAFITFRAALSYPISLWCKMLRPCKTKSLLIFFCHSVALTFGELQTVNEIRNVSYIIISESFPAFVLLRSI